MRTPFWHLPPVLAQPRVGGCMSATVISLDDARRRRETSRRTAGELHRRPALSVFYFDLADPFTYLAAERVQRALPGAVWRPASAAALARDAGVCAAESLC